MVDSNALKHVITVDGIFRTDFQAGGILTLLAAHGYVNANMFPLDDLDTG
jgi:hypothetical protein